MRCRDQPSLRLGLRERKKLLTRQAILDTARTMFEQHGYDNVTVSEIADAVNISAKTVFVYFPSKEDLVFVSDDEVCEVLLNRIRDRPAGETPLDAMADAVRVMMSESDSPPVAELDRMHRMVGTSLTLQSRWRPMWEKFERSMAEALASELGEHPHAPRPSILAAQLILLLRSMASEQFVGYLRAHDEPNQLAAAADWLDVSLELIGGGIGEFARRPAAPASTAADAGSVGSRG